MTPDTLPQPATPAPLSKGTDVLLTRRRWDFYFLPTTVVATALGIGMIWATGELKGLVAPVAPLGLWMFMRYSTPRTGMTDRRLSSEPEMLWLLAWGGLGVAGVILIFFLILPATGRMPEDGLTYSDLAWLIPYFLVLIAGIALIARRHERRANRSKTSPAAAGGV